MSHIPTNSQHDMVRRLDLKSSGLSLTGSVFQFPDVLGVCVCLSGEEHRLLSRSASLHTLHSSDQTGSALSLPFLLDGLIITPSISQPPARSSVSVEGRFPPLNKLFLSVWLFGWDVSPYEHVCSYEELWMLALRGTVQRWKCRMLIWLFLEFFFFFFPFRSGWVGSLTFKP